MTTSDELMSHAARCARLAEAITDQAVAEKLRKLAKDYCDLAAQAPNGAQSVCQRQPQPSDTAVSVTPTD